MKVNFNPYFKNYIHQKSRLSNPISPLGFDSVSFGAMKKEEFFKNGIDFTVVKTLKAPVAEFNSYDDFDLWCQKRISEIKNKRFNGKKFTTSINRLLLINKWANFLSDEENVSNAFVLLILSNLTRELKESNDKIPIYLNKKVASDTIRQIKEKLKQNQKTLINFEKLYRKNLQKFYLTGDITLDDNSCSNYTGWVYIPSKRKDEENYFYNVERFIALSPDTWCSAGEVAARGYIDGNDIHLYLENGKTRLGLCVNHIGRVVVADDETNERRIPYDCIDEVKRYMEQNSFLTLPIVQEEIVKAEIEKAKHFI